MIDCHCHLSEPDYQKDRDRVIEKCKKQLKAVITCCAHPNDFNLTMQMLEKHKNFVFATLSIHPIHIEEFNEKQKDEFLDLIVKNRDRIVGIGETGLDYYYYKNIKWQQKQKELFAKLISLAKELKKPIVVHSRDSTEDAVKILEQEDAKQVLMHLFGVRHILTRVLENNWFISVGPIAQRSKKHKKIIRDTPLEKIFLETDSPWFGPEGKKNDPTAVLGVAKRIAEVKKLNLGEVDRITTDNAIKFFDLKIE